MPSMVRGQSDKTLQAISKALGDFQKDHPRASIEMYRQNPACIRLRIIDPDFKGMDRVARDELLWEYLDGLDDEILAEVAFLLLLTPAEVKKSLANADFEDRELSRL